MDFVKVILYGAGKRCRDLCKILLKSDMKIAAVVDSDSARWGEEFEGYLVQPPGILKNMREIYFCITVADFDLQKVIRDELSHGYCLKQDQEIEYCTLIFEAYKQNVQISNMLRGWKRSRAEREVLFGCLNGLMLGGIEAWTINICETLIKSGQKDVSIVLKNGSFNPSHGLENHIVCVDIDDEIRFSIDSIVNVIEALLCKLPCKLVTSQADEIFIASTLIKHYLPEMIEIVSVIHGGVEKIYEEYIAFKDYVDCFVGVSRDIVSAMSEKGIEPERLYSMSCPFECEENLNRTYTEDQDASIRLGYAGRIEYTQKRMDLLLKCIELLETKNINFYMELAGDGRAREELEQFLAEKNLCKKVKFLGKLERSEMAAFWKRQDICVNIADYEGRSISIIEAMGNGAVPVVTDTSGTGEDITDGINGYRVPVGDYARMADRIEYLANHRECLKNMGALAHDEVYPKSLMGPHLKFWRELLFDDTDNSLISVIVPIYNSEKYLDECISSICSQTYKNLEIILVNDGSADSSLDICLKYQKEDSRIKVISQENKGLIEARKTGVHASSGNIIGFVDSDDWIEPDMYKQLYRIFKNTDADLVSSGLTWEYEDSRSVVTFDNYEEGLYADLERDVYPTMLFDEQVYDFGLYCNLVNKLFKKDLLKRTYESIDSNVFYGEDCLTLYTYCLTAGSIYIIKKSYYHYNIRQGTMCSAKDERLLYNSYLLYSELKKQFYKYREPYVLMRQLKKYMLQIELHNLQTLYDINIASLGIWKFDYGEIIQNKKIVIYGAGACGQAFYDYLKTRRIKIRIAAWIDKSPSNKSEQCLYQIDAPEVLERLEFDYIVIAVLKKEVSEIIREELVNNYQIQEAKIIWRKTAYIPVFRNNQLSS